MTDLEITRLCAEAMGWKYLGPVGVNVPQGMRPIEVEKKYPGQLWCLSGSNDWWKDPEGNNVCGHCQSIPAPLHDDAQAMALVKRFKVHIGWTKDGKIAKAGFHEDADLNRAICEYVAAMQAAK